MRNAIVIGAALGLMACAPKMVELGNGDDGIDASAPLHEDSGLPDYVAPGTCDATSAGGAISDGNGYYASEPPACSTADGAPQTFASAAALQSALVGTWFDCGASGDSLLTALGGGDAIQLTSDGHFSLLNEGVTATFSKPGDGTLVPAQGATSADGGASGTTLAGTYQVIDVSASLGAGTWQIQLQSSQGASYLAQVLVVGTPAKLRFVYADGPSTEEFAPALPLTFRAGVCDYQSPNQFGPVLSSLTDAEMTSRLTGAWIWCAGAPFPGDDVGFEFPGDGSWYSLVEDVGGNVSRSTAGTGHGTVSIKNGYLSLGYASPQGESSVTTPLFAECESSLGFVVSTSSLTGNNPPEEGPIYQRTTKSY